MNLVFYLVLSTQTVTLHFLFAFGEVQPVFPCESLAHRHIAYGIVTVADGVPGIVHPVCHDVQVRMFLVCVTACNILGVHNAHALHVLTCYFSHQAVRQLGRVLVGEVQRDVVHRIFQLAPRFVFSLSLHTRCYGCIVVKPHVLAVYEPCLFRIVHVVHQLGEARPFLQVAHHISAMILLNSSSRAVILSLVLGKPC